MAMPITLIPVNSSAIRALGYEDGTLQVEFHDSGLYEYRDVPPGVLLDFLNAPSIGRYFDRHVKNRYSTRRLE